MFDNLDYDSVPPEKPRTPSYDGTDYHPRPDIDDETYAQLWTAYAQEIYARPEVADKVDWIWKHMYRQEMRLSQVRTWRNWAELCMKELSKEIKELKTALAAATASGFALGPQAKSAKARSKALSAEAQDELEERFHMTEWPVQRLKRAAECIEIIGHVPRESVVTAHMASLQPNIAYKGDDLREAWKVTDERMKAYRYFYTQRGLIKYDDERRVYFKETA